MLEAVLILVVGLMWFGFANAGRANRKKLRSRCAYSQLICDEDLHCLDQIIKTGQAEQIKPEERQYLLKTLNIWVCRQIEACRQNRIGRSKKMLLQIVPKVIQLCRTGHWQGIKFICRGIVELTSVDERYDLIGKYLKFAARGNVVTNTQTLLLSKIAAEFELDSEKVRQLSQKTIPLGLYESEELEFILGVSGDMDTEQIRARLNSEYQKWNSRVTNPDSDIREQVESMLSLIASTRQKLVEQTV